MSDEKKKSNSMKILRIALICVFAAIFITSTVMFIVTLIGYSEASDLYDDVHNDFIDAIGATTGDNSIETTANYISVRPSEPQQNPAETSGTPAVTDSGTAVTTVTKPAVTEAVTTAEPKPVVYSEKFLNSCEFIKSLQAVNEQVVGYIYIEFGAGVESISYPLVQGEDNLYYVTHAYDKSELRAGAIFLDYRCEKNLDNNDVTLIFGHNMNNSSMFHRLTNFKQQKYFDNATITVYTLDAIYNYKAFAVYNTTSDSNYNYLYFDTPAEYLEFLNNAQSQSMLNNHMTFYESDKILTLSTCLNTTDTARLAVHAVLVSVEQ